MFKCQDDSYIEDLNSQKVQKNEVQEKKQAKEKKRKKIKYKGYEVNHRFNSTENELKEKHTKNYLKKLYNKLRKKHKKESSKTSQDLEIPNHLVLFEASKVVVGNLPYEELDGLTVNVFNENSFVNVNMILSDFENFDENDIVINNEVLDEYYSKNLDYLVLEEIAMHPEIYDNMVFKNQKNSEFWIATCSIARALKNGYGLIRSTIAYVIATPKAKSESLSKYPSSMGSANTRKDVFRHILWNALLAQNYFTISSKSKRTGFANLITTARETSCSDGAGNPEDSKEMDFHNNFIGRKIWDDNTTYRYFLGAAIGLRRPSTSFLINATFGRVESISCFVIKEENPNDSFDYTISETKTEILNINPTTPVYFIGPIADKLP